MKHNIIDHSNNIYVVRFDQNVNVDQIQPNLLYLADKGVSTFGNISTEILRPQLEKEGFNIEKNDLCFDDDLSLELQMPQTWYVNRGTNAISTAMYYNFLNFKEMAKAGVLFTKNKEASEKYGRIGIVEVYLQNKLEEFLLSNGINYFGTPKTLTECMRVLEGWNIKRVPRLKAYVPYANFIKLWCEVHFPGFMASEWGLGENKSNLIFKGTGTTNVREGLKFFWKNYLLKRKNKIGHGDAEIDVLSEFFYKNRQPDFILIGEDVFSEDSKLAPIKFKQFNSPDVISVGRSDEKNGKDILTAQLSQKLFPEAKIIVFQNNSPLPNFTMCKLDEIKKGVNREVALIASTLSYFLKHPKI